MTSWFIGQRHLLSSLIDLSSTPETPLMEGENHFLQVVFCLHHTIINKYKIQMKILEK